MFAVSFLTLHLVFSGLAVALILRERSALFSLLPLAMLCGLLLNLSMILMLHSLTATFALGGILDVAVAVCLYRLRRQLPSRLFDLQIAPHAKRGKFARPGIIAFIFLLLAGAAIYSMLFDPIKAWDARSIWFFHGKILYYADGLKTKDWGITFSHTDYPILIPALAAQVAMIVGYWNEYLPLTCLAILLCVECAVLACLAETLSFLVCLLIIALLVFGLPPELTNGYADMHLALFAMAACGLFVKFGRTRKPVDVVLAILCLGVIACLKNEGMVLALIIGLSSAVALVLDSKLFIKNQVPALPHRHVMAAIVLSVLPAVLWQCLIIAWGLKNDMTADGGNALTRISSRLNRETLDNIISLLGSMVMLGACLAATVANLRNRQIRNFSCHLPLVCSSMYLAVLILVYLATPHDLSWQLYTSAPRVGLAIKAMLAFGTANFLDMLIQPRLATSRIDSIAFA